MAEENKNRIKKQVTRKYLSKDFAGLRSELLNHAKVYFPDQMSDFSETSLGGLLLEMAAYVGDNLSYYLDHQYNELNYETVTEVKNLQQHIRNAGLQVSGNSPSTVYMDFYIKVPSELKNGVYIPNESNLPIILKDTVVSSTAGIDFQLIDDVDFKEKDSTGQLTAQITAARGPSSNPSSFFLRKSGLCVSGKKISETFAIPNEDLPFRELLLTEAHVSSIDRVYDSQGNEYYEVDSLAQDTVFKAVINTNYSSDGVRNNIQVIPANYRFIKSTDINTRTTKIMFGSGKPDLADDDIIADPGVMALPLYGKETLTKFSIDPNSILRSKTLGIYPKNTTITVVYKYGGGASHNIPANSLASIKSLNIKFPVGSPVAVNSQVINSIDVRNSISAKGGSNAPSISELRNMIPSGRNMQNRIVTREDLLARLFTLPAEFGRVYRASITNNPNNPLASILYVLSRNNAGRLVQAPDALKLNLRTYLNEFRLISDALDILDADIVNYKVHVKIVVVPGMVRNDVIKKVIEAVKSLTGTDLYQIGQPIIEADFINAVYNVVGVQAIEKLEFLNVKGNVDGRDYSSLIYDFSSNKNKGMFFVKQNTIFEMRYPSYDIEVTA